MIEAVCLLLYRCVYITYVSVSDRLIANNTTCVYYITSRLTVIRYGAPSQICDEST